VRARTTAAAPFDPPLPPKWTPTEYVSWSARLAGLSRHDAAAATKDALARLQLSPLATTQLARLVPHARRGVVVAAALATGASVLLLEDPIGALSEEAARNFGNVLGSALEGRSWIAFAPRVPLTSPLALQAEEAIVVSGARVDAQGAPAEIAAAVKRFSLRVNGPLDALAAKLTQRGARVHQEGTRVLVDLGDSMTTADLLGLAGESQVTIVELHPVSRALA
ncbi:MAG TPA: hypothetical protein VIF62_04870, partial [Labilithrix sp.]